MGLSSSVTNSHPYGLTHKLFVLTNYILLGAASACIFLTLSLRLIPSLIGFLLILLHILTIAAAISGCAAASSGAGKWYAAHMASTVLTAIFQGSVSVLIFTRTPDFLANLHSYVRDKDGSNILKLVGVLCLLIFCFQWLALFLAFFVKYYAFRENDSDFGTTKRSAKVNNQGEEELDYLPYHV